MANCVAEQVYVVVQFKDKSTRAIPNTWICGTRRTGETKCYWPNTSNEKKMKAYIEQQKPPSDKWGTCSCMVLSVGYKTLTEALEFEDKFLKDHSETEWTISKASEALEEEASEELDENIIPISDTSLEGNVALSSILEKVVQMETQLKKLKLSFQTQMEEQGAVLRQMFNILNVERNGLQGKILFTGCTLPITCIGEFQQLNIILSEEDQRKNFISYMSRCGGIEIKRATYLVLEKCISADFAETINWDGRGEKHGIKIYTNFISAILEILEENPLIERPTMEGIKEYIQIWMQSSKSRNGTYKKNANL